MATITDESASAAGALRQAIADFDRAIGLDPTNAAAFLNRGITQGAKAIRPGPGTGT